LGEVGSIEVFSNKSPKIYSKQSLSFSSIESINNEMNEVYQRTVKNRLECEQLLKELKE